MLFNSFEFPVFLIIVFLLYWFATNGQRTVQNALIVVASYVFYGWWDWRFLFLIFISSCVDFFIGIQIHETPRAQKTKRKRLLFLSLAINIGALFVFKYFNFFIDSFAFLLDDLGLNANQYSLNIILPVGISFYTFQTLSYTIDIYREKLVPTRSPLSFFAFVSFFSSVGRRTYRKSF